MTTSLTPQAPTRRIGGGPTRSVAAASWTALGALMLRDLVVVRKHWWEFVLRTIIQPFLLCFVFLFVFPKIGQGIGGGHGTAAESAFATMLVPGVVGISIMFQGVQSIALNMAQEFGFTREIEDRVQAPCPIWLVAMAKVLSGAAQGVISAIIVLPMASVVHAPGVHAHLSLHWWIILTFVPLACVAMAGLGLVLGTSFEPRNIGLMFGFIILPITFLGGTYYSWTRLAPVHGRRLALAADPRADQPADLRERGDAGRVHRGAAHAPVRDLPGGGRVRGGVPGHRAAELPPPRAVLRSPSGRGPRLARTGPPMRLRHRRRAAGALRPAF